MPQSISFIRFLFILFFLFSLSFWSVANAQDDSDEIDDEFEEAVKKGDLKKPEEIKDIEKLGEGEEEVKKEKIEKKEEESEEDKENKGEEIPDYQEESIDFNKPDIDSPLPYRGKSAVGAFALSFFIGFGAGNFYSENMSVAYATLLAEAIGLGAGAAGWVLLLYISTDPNDPNKPLDYDFFDSEPLPEEILAMSGTAIFAVSRIIDITCAVLSTINYNRGIKTRFISRTNPIKPVVSSDWVGISVEF